MVFMNHEGMRASTPEHHHISESLGTLFIDHPEVDETYYENRDIYQSLLFCEGNELDYYREHHREAFDYIRWHRVSCDVLPKGGSKAEGIKRLIEATGLSMEDVYAFGDGLNDIEMLEQAGVGVAMGNAVNEAKQVSDFITDDVDHNGLSKALYEVGLLDAE
jgi:Cof subfamily protein (haloacid dehalogenase superfamily)